MNAPERESNVLGHFFLNYKHILIDEISLEGLEGITLDLLWRRVALRISSPITEKMKVRFWKNILESKEISVYQLPEPLPQFELRDRFTIVDPDTGDLHDSAEYLDGPYEYCPVPNEYGSSKYFTTRRLIPLQQLLEAPYEKIELGYGNTLVLVASIEKRWQALASHAPIAHMQTLMPVQYCLLELIGKSRDNGQMTTGTTNLTNIIKEPKNLFYHRKCLKNLDLVKVVCITQTMAGRGIKGLLLRLNRFHKPTVLSVPKVGKIHKVIEYLRSCPNYTAKADILLSMRFFTQPQTKKIRKNNNIFDFFHKQDDGEPPSKRRKLNPKKRRCISIITNSDESSQSDEELPEEPVKCKFKIGVSLIRQAYELFLEAGLKGISQIELGQALGVEFYTTRMLCRCLKAKKLVREFFEDKGKQRISRYVAVVAGVRDTDYIEERNKFLEHIQSNNSSFQLDDEIGEMAGTSELIIPDTIPDISCNMAPDSMKEYESTHITELTVTHDEKMNIKSLIESNKSLTLRQLKFGNGVIKIINEKKCVTGLQTLSNLVGKEINEPPMVSKALKEFLKKLVAAGQIKLYKVRWPGSGNELNYMNLICAPHIKITDPIVKAKYKEVHLRALAKRKVPKLDTSEGSSKPLSMFVNPRYMKIQKLHEVIMKLAYFDPLLDRLNEKPGFLSVTDLMPEMSVKFAISNMSTTGMSEISHLKIEDHHFNMKLKDAPPEIAHGIMKCKSLRNALRMNLKALGMYGLIQLIYQPDIQTVDYFNSTLTTFLFYVNRNASIIKTNGIWPRECNIKSLEKRYYFETFEDVKKYWRDVYDFSIDTTIVLKEPRAKKTLTPPIRREDEVDLYDNGARYGDGKGPCGLDSCFYLEIARLWRTYYVRETKPAPQPEPKKSVVKIPKLAKSKKKAAPKKKPPAKVVNPVMKIKTITIGRKRIPESTITWTKQEDDIIVMCLVAMAIASPSSQPGSLRVRNVAAKDILTLKDEKKTQSACHRRVLMLQLNPSLMHEKDSLLNEMRRRRHLICKYEGMIRKLRVRYSTNMTKYMNEARVPILELVWLIWKVSKSESYNKRVPCVAITVDNFHENFTITPNTTNKIYNIYKSPDLAMLREAVFLSIILTYRNEIKSETAKKIYAIFKKYPENNLRIVVEQLRRSGAVSAKEKLFNNQMHRLHLEDLASSAYKISAHYVRRWLGRLNSEFAVSLSKFIYCELPTNNIKGCAEINCVLCELQALGYLEMKTAVKPAVVEPPGFSTDQMNVLDIETKHKLKSGSVTWERKSNGEIPWTSNTVSSLYKDLDCEPILKAMQKSAIVSSDTDLKHEYDTNDVIIRHLDDKGDSGSSFKELQKVTKYSRDLVQRLNQLESENIIKRVGLQDNVIILLKYIKNWALKVDKKYVIITPWLTMDFDIRYEILLEWCGAIVNKVFEYPGSSIAFLADSFELITCRALQDACMFLHYAKCVTLKVIKCETPDLFTDEDVEPVTSEFNVYESTENIFIYPVKNSISRYLYLRKMLLDRQLNK